MQHDETEWSRTGQYTSITDLPLTNNDREEAKVLNDWLNPKGFGLMLASPHQRTQEAIRLARLHDFEVEEDLAEWFYDDYEGTTLKEVQKAAPDWQIWTYGVSNGEAAEGVRERVERVAKRVRESSRDKAILFVHGHLLRALTTAWLELPIAPGQSFPLNTVSLSVLGHYHDRPAVLRWNLSRGLQWRCTGVPVNSSVPFKPPTLSSSVRGVCELQFRRFRPRS